MSCKHLENRITDISGDKANSLELQRTVCLIREHDQIKKEEIDAALKNTPHQVMISTDQCPVAADNGWTACPHFEAK